MPQAKFVSRTPDSQFILDQTRTFTPMRDPVHPKNPAYPIIYDEMNGKWSVTTPKGPRQLDAARYLSKEGLDAAMANLERQGKDGWKYVFARQDPIDFKQPGGRVLFIYKNRAYVSKPIESIDPPYSVPPTQTQAETDALEVVSGARGEVEGKDDPAGLEIIALENLAKGEAIPVEEVVSLK